MKWKKLYNLIWILVTFPKRLRAAMEGYVVGGLSASIDDYPYSAFLGVQCNEGKGRMNWICGSSIVNQHILLTAAHCVDTCLGSSKINIVVGSKNKKKGVKSTGKKFLVHEKHDAVSGENDIALVMVTTPFKLNNLVSRVALVKKLPSFNEEAVVAGWGKINEIKNIGTPNLMYTNQRLWSRTNCMKMMNWSGIPRGCFCGGSLRADNYASAGDSGSALVVKGYIQIGLVSHKLPEISMSVVVYTDIHYFYNWIKETAPKLFCDS